MSASGPGTLSYAWKKDGDIITSENYPHCSGFDSDTLTISPLTILDEGNYSCVISNEEGLSIESELTTVKGLQSPQIISENVAMLASMTFSLSTTHS